MFEYFPHPATSGCLLALGKAMTLVLSVLLFEVRGKRLRVENWRCVRSNDNQFAKRSMSSIPGIGTKNIPLSQHSRPEKMDRIVNWVFPRKLGNGHK